MTKIEIVATGPDLIEKGIRGIEPVLEEVVMGAKNEIHMMVYMFTSGALHILNLIENAAERGIRLTMVANDLQSQDARILSKLKEIGGRFPHAKIFDFTDPEKRQLHAKIIVADRRIALVGSANLSWGGMYSNYEIGLLIEGEPAWKLAEIVDTLSIKLK
mgnify:CR=1 FL=1